MSADGSRGMEAQGRAALRWPAGAVRLGIGRPRRDTPPAARGYARRPRTVTSSESGQALVLAVVVMLLVVFLGSIFLRTVLANLRHAEHAGAAANEYTAAEAGIRFADTNLVSSELGADWRPRPYYNIAAIAASAAGAFLTQDPDYYWIQPFDVRNPADPSDDVGGYIRYNLGDSRFLLRVTYNPENSVYVRDAAGNTIPGPNGNPLGLPVMPDVVPGSYDASTTRFGPTELSRYVMIEAVGRRGSAAEIDKEYQDFIDSNGADPIDPTVFGDTTQALNSSGAYRFRRELVAFKAIGINNYLRFVTDRAQLGRPTYLGVDQLLIRDGETPSPNLIDLPFRVGIDADRFQSDFAARATGGPIRVNGDLVWFGSALPTDDNQPEVSVSLTNESFNGQERVAHQKVEVAGRIRREGTGQDSDSPNLNRMVLRLYPPGASSGSAPLEAALPASENPEFETLVRNGSFAGRYLDNAWLTASPAEKANFDPRRSVQRLDPPQIEVTDPTSGRLRYQVITQAGAARADAANPWKGQTAGRYGYGAGIYLDNARHSGEHRRCSGDVQYNHNPEKLRADWVRPYAQVAPDSGWKYPGRVYEPPAVIIALEPDWSNGGTNPEHGLIRITRNDSTGWRDPLGRRMAQRTLFFELRPGPPPAIAGNSREYTLLPKWWDSGSGTWKTWDWTRDEWVDLPGSVPDSWRYPFNGVIFAEGNVRIRGCLPQDTAQGGVRLTVVSRGTIYIDGNLVKGPPVNANAPARSQIALLARDYVCLNTTQFVQVETDTSFVAAGDNGPPYFWRLANNEPERAFLLSWDFGVQPNDDSVREYYNRRVGQLGYGPALFLRHQAAGAPATMQWLVNNVPYNHPLWAPFDSATPQAFYPLLNAGEWSYFADHLQSPARPFELYTGGGLTIPAGQNYALDERAGHRNQIRIQQYDPGSPDGSLQTTGGDYNLGAAAIQPLDIMVTALIYAEHYSWFVIPGTFFQDTTAGDPEPSTDCWRYPKNCEPLDVQIHIRGGISEGQAASLEDVTLWTAHWRGANRTEFERAGTQMELDDSDFSRRGGINYAFDPLLITDTRLVRFSEQEPAYYLPGTPRLPMCPGMVYFGERPLQ